MQTRFYLCPVIGAGDESDPCRPKVALYPVSWSCQIATAEDGFSLQAMCIAEVTAEDFSALEADTELIDVTAS